MNALGCNSEPALTRCLWDLLQEAPNTRKEAEQKAPGAEGQLNPAWQ